MALIQDLIMFLWDYCSNLLTICPFPPLQFIFYRVNQMILLKCTAVHVTLLLKYFQWFPQWNEVPSRRDSKTLWATPCYSSMEPTSQPHLSKPPGPCTGVPSVWNVIFFFSVCTMYVYLKNFLHFILCKIFPDPSQKKWGLYSLFPGR